VIVWNHHLRIRSTLVNSEKYIGLDVHQATISVTITLKNVTLIGGYPSSAYYHRFCDLIVNPSIIRLS